MDRGPPYQGPPSTQRLSGTLKRLVQLFDPWGKKDKADKWRKELETTQGK
jgi:hypothetical protein